MTVLIKGIYTQYVYLGVSGNCKRTTNEIAFKTSLKAKRNQTDKSKELLTK